jgi:membrane protease YdiL (CAAX protease family)
LEDDGMNNGPGSGAPVPRLPTALAVAVALVFPTIIAWSYFVSLAGTGKPNPAQQLTYAAGKVVQFSIPLLYFALVLRRRPAWQAPTRDGLFLGVGFALLVAAAMFAVYFGGLRSSSLFAATGERIRQRVQELGLGTPLGYLALSAFLCVAHSFLEEYYWRWFVFGRLRALLPFAPALALASLGFMAHHVVILWVFFPGKVLTAVVPAALGVAAGGAVWAWIYERGGSLLAPWLSHLLIDAALFAIGWDLVQGAA